MAAHETEARVAPPFVVLGVCGGIAAYKAVEVLRRLTDRGAHVVPVLTEAATRFIGPITFSALASEPAQTSLFGDEPIPHTRLGQAADLVVVAPATAKLIGKLAGGISDDLLTATLLATRASVLIAPAMHTEMWEHPAVQDNLELLRRRGVTVVAPEHGRLAGGDEGEGRLADPERIVANALALLGRDRLAGRRVLVTAGGTREPIDPVRYVGNRSSGKMGHALAIAAAHAGATVTLVTTTALAGSAVAEVVRVETADEMQAAVTERFADCDAVIMAAAVADFRPKAVADTKLKKVEGPPEVMLEPTVDILAGLGASRTTQVLVGFAAETSNIVEHARAKLERKGVDLMVANDVTEPDAGFEVDTNRVILLDSSGEERLPLMSKPEVASVIIERLAALLAAD